MSDPFIRRGETLRQRLLERERHADEADLFSLGYLIPQVELVLDRAEYDPHQVTSKDFDLTCWALIEQSSHEDHMPSEDVAALDTLWHQLCRLT